MLLGSVMLIILSLASLLLRRRLLRGKACQAEPTWGCGYSFPSARMQYSASSYAQPAGSFFRMILRPRRFGNIPGSAVFPARPALTTQTPEIMTRKIYAPLFASVRRIMAGMAWIQQGRVHLYVLYVVLALIISLIFAFGETCL